MRDYETEAGEWATAVQELAVASAPPGLADAYAICHILAVISAAAQAEDAPATLLVDTLGTAVSVAGPEYPPSAPADRPAHAGLLLRGAGRAGCSATWEPA